MMSKPKAHVLLILFDILAILVFWIGYNEINQVVAGIAHSAESVKFNNRVGFFFIGILVPTAHLFAVYEYFWPNIAKKKVFINRSAFVLLISLFAACLISSIGVRLYVERAGYLHCPQADSSMTFCTYLVYTKDDSICHQLVAEKSKPRRY